MTRMRRLLPTVLLDVDIAEAFAVPDGGHLRAQFISSVDGASAVGGASGGLGGEEDRALLLTLRGLADAVLVGATTARRENYGGVKLDDELRRHRQDAGRPASPPVVVVSARAEFDPGARLFLDTTVPPIVVTTERAAANKGRDLEGLAELLPAGKDEVDLRVAVDKLHERGLHALHCEGGPALLGRLVEADLVDELTMTFAPVIAGGDANRIVRGAPAFDPPRTLRLESLFAGDGGYLFARYALH